MIAGSGRAAGTHGQRSVASDGVSCGQSELTILLPPTEIEFATMASRANEPGKRWDIAATPRRAARS